MNIAGMQIPETRIFGVIIAFLLFLIYVLWYGIHISNGMHLFYTSVYFCVFIVFIWISVIVSNDEIKIFNHYTMHRKTVGLEQNKLIT